MRALILTLHGRAAPVTVYGPTGWVAGQWSLRGTPAWATYNYDENRAYFTAWDGSRYGSDVGVAREVDLPDPPRHVVVAEHLLMAGWHRVWYPITKKDGPSVVEGRSPSGVDYALNVDDALADGLDAFTEWIRREQA